MADDRGDTVRGGGRDGLLQEPRVRRIEEERRKCAADHVATPSVSKNRAPPRSSSSSVATLKTRGWTGPVPSRAQFVVAQGEEGRAAHR